MLRRNFSHLCLLEIAAICVLSAFAGNALAITITVDYSYDTFNTTGYFSDSANACQRSALEAAASRWSNIIDSNLLATSIIDDNTDGRISFFHPGTGALHDISGAGSAATDALAGAATVDEYRSIFWAADEWILFAGARPLASAGIGGPGSGGTNFSTVFNDPNSHLYRGVNGATNLVTWGGSIAFDTGTTWGCNGDFYTVALHEIGHALGLSTSDAFDENLNDMNGNLYEGMMAVMAANMDNGTSLTALNLEPDANNQHWIDNNADGTDSNTVGGDGPVRTDGLAVQSFIFPFGGPDYLGTVGPGVLQDLLMEPVSNFTGSVSRIEVTNVEAGAIKDLGWTVVPEPSPVALVFAAAIMLLSAIRRPS